MADILNVARFQDTASRRSCTGVPLSRTTHLCAPHGTGNINDVQFSSWTSRPLKMGPIRCSETSVKDYHSTLRNALEECRSEHTVCSSPSATL
jgi:hypothetical protein